MSHGFGAALKVDDGKPRLPGSLHLNRRLSQWLHFRADGVVEVKPGKVELGQGILTALAQIAADELDVPLERVRIISVVTPESPDEAVTSGSLSVQDSGSAIRHASADARRIFLSVAAQRSGVAFEAVTVTDGDFIGPQGKIGSYWQFAEAGLLEVEASPDARAKPASARRLVGISAPRRDLPGKLRGAPAYVHDLRLAGMMHARVIRPSVRGATLAALKDGPLPGDARLVRDGNFLAVLASTEWDAEAAAARITARAEWHEADTLPEQLGLIGWLRDAATRGERKITAERTAEVPAAAHRFKRSFFRPYLAHASIGPSCAVARFEGDQVEVFSHTQGPYNLRADIAKTLRCPLEKVIIRHMEGAGCYGHNGADDVALEAVLIARAAGGKPVRLMWTRADELGWAPFSPAMLVDIEVSAAADGSLLSWHSEVISNGHSGRPGRSPVPTLLAASHLAEPFPVQPSINPPLAAGGGAERNAIPGYQIPDLFVATTRLLDMPIRTSALRGLGATLNVWAVENVMDEMAALVGEDPLTYRLRHLEDARGRAVLESVAAMAKWTERAPRAGFGYGIAYARYKNTGAYAAVIAEIEAQDRIFCRRLWIAADCGEVVNPDGAVNQLEGGAIHGASIALVEEVRFDRRRVTSDSWDSLPILRFSEVPKVDVALINRPEAPFLGAGEASLAPAIAAIAGGIHAALGVRPWQLPFSPESIAKAG